MGTMRGNAGGIDYVTSGSVEWAGPIWAEIGVILTDKRDKSIIDDADAWFVWSLLNA